MYSYILDSRTRVCAYANVDSAGKIYPNISRFNVSLTEANLAPFFSRQFPVSHIEKNMNAVLSKTKYNHTEIKQAKRTKKKLS